MRREQLQWRPGSGWNGRGAVTDASIVFAFGARDALREAAADLGERYRQAILFGCSTAGEIAGDEVVDGTVVATAVRFAATRLVGACVRVEDYRNSREAGEALAGQLRTEDLAHVLVLSDGLRVNGSELARGLTGALPPGVGVTGGLSADGSQFEETLVVFNDTVGAGLIAAVGFYGERLQIGCGSLGGWDQFGPERMVTRAVGNVLFELDEEPALGLYKRYLGDHARELPSSGLLFPLAIRTGEDGATLVRTILSVNDTDGSLTFAGDVPEGSFARLMKANFDRLVDGATGAAQAAATVSRNPDLALLISCVGRKLVLKQRVEEEIEGVREVLGQRALLTGFYSYGEISPFVAGGRCELHNQTMTITTFSED
ncbi:MAG: FIST C-terminal domain-containing protein [Bryobacteraceae bacterium]